MILDRIGEKQRLRERVDLLDVRLKRANELVKRYLDALEDEDGATRVRILERVWGESPKAER